MAEARNDQAPEPAGLSASIAYVTCAANGLYGLERLLARGHRISCVITIPPEVGRKNNVAGYVDVLPVVRRLAIPVISLANYSLGVSDLEGVRAEILIVNGWNRLIDQAVIDHFPLGGLGIHAGHPPIGHGRAPLVWNILNGRTDLEVYVFRLTPQADDGAIMSRRPVEITPHDTVQMLYEKVMDTGAELFDLALRSLALGQPGQHQNIAEKVVYPRRRPEDGLIDFTWDECRLYNFIRAQSSPYPGAFTFLDGIKWRMERAVPFDRFAGRDQPRRPGRVIAALPSGLVVETGGSPLWINEAYAEGNRRVPAALIDLQRLVGARFGGSDPNDIGMPPP